MKSVLSLTLYKWYQYCLDIKTQKAAKKREQWESEHPRNNGRHGRRQKRSISVEHHVETLVVVDPDMTEYYKNEDVTNYVLTIMNMVCFKNVLPFHILDGHLNLKENDKLKCQINKWKRFYLVTCILVPLSHTGFQSFPWCLFGKCSQHRGCSNHSIGGWTGSHMFSQQSMQYVSFQLKNAIPKFIKKNWGFFL